MTAGPTFAGTALPDAFIGVPYLVGLPLLGVASATPTSVSVNGLPVGLTAVSNGGAAVVSGTVQVSTSTGSQADAGPYTANLTVSFGNGGSTVGSFTMNVHYLPGDQDQTPAQQAAIRDGVLAIDANTQFEDVGTVSLSADFPTVPSIPSNLG
jgi:hypothetical protein